MFLETGSQIVTPIDTEIAALIGDFDPLDIPIAAEDDALIFSASTPHGVRRTWQRPPGSDFGQKLSGVQIAYTAMHGVGGDTVAAAFTAAGFDPPAVVAEQQEPDGTFPTVSFPNPEEPGAMDLLLAAARSSGGRGRPSERSRCRSTRCCNS